MRAALTIVLFLTSLISFGQNALKVSVVPYSTVNATTSFPFDTVFVNSASVNRHFLLKEIQVNDSVFRIENLSSGTYKLTFVSNKFIYNGPIYYIAICSKCDNSLSIRADSLKAGAEDISMHWDKPFATYSQFNRNSDISHSLVLQRDFFKGLSQREIARIKHKTFAIRAFIVKGVGLCDISVKPNSLSSREKTILLKGFANLKGWETLWKNAEIQITSKELFDD